MSLYCLYIISAETFCYFWQYSSLSTNGDKANQTQLMIVINDAVIEVAFVLVNVLPSFNSFTSLCMYLLVISKNKPCLNKF